MDLSSLTKTTKSKKRRLGQGHGSGRVKTAGRGTKGQNARGRMPIFFEGGALTIIKRLPFRRGKGKTPAFGKRPFVLNVKVLNLLPPNTVVDIKALIAHKIIDKDSVKFGIKILGDGELKNPLTVLLPTSKNAAKKIEKAGGKIIIKN